MMQMKEYKEVPQNEGVIVQQPGANRTIVAPENWMSIPVNNCSVAGLEYLSALDQLLISQKVEKLELLTGFETKNKFKVKNSLGQNVYFAMEESDCCSRNCLGRSRPFELKIMDNIQNEVMRFYRPYRCELCFCFPNCLNALEVCAPPGNNIGTIEEVCSFLRARYNIKNASGDVILRIEGPVCPLRCCNDVNFKILNGNDEVVGKISKQWSGFGREIFTDADYFNVSFPLNMDVRMKALIFAAAFLIDIVFYEV